jgi:hypothetical protein
MQRQFETGRRGRSETKQGKQKRGGRRNGSSPPSEISKKTMGLPLSSSSGSSAMAFGRVGSSQFGDGDEVEKSSDVAAGSVGGWRNWRNGTEHQLMGGPPPRSSAATAQLRQSNCGQRRPCVVR